MGDWLRECEICNVGLCKEMTYLTNSVEKGGVGLSVREAAKRLEEQAVKEIGEKVWSAEQIRYRFLYHTGQLKEPGRKPTTPKEATTSEEIETVTIDKEESPATVSPDAPLCERDKEAFLKLIQRIHHEWAEVIGLEKEDNMEWTPCGYFIFPVSDQGKEIRSPGISVTAKQFKKLMGKYPEPIEIRILAAMANLEAHMRSLDRVVPVPDEVYKKIQTEEEKKQTKKEANRKEKGG
jgi:hypothetical protein